MKKKEAAKKAKKKRWYPIVAPKLFREQILGESLVADPVLLEGKPLKINLMNLTGDAKRQNINIGFTIVKVTDGKGMTRITKYSVLPSSLKRMVRRGRDKIDDSFLARTKDKVFVRVKPLIVTKNRSPHSQQQKIRLEAKKFLRSVISERPFEQLAEEVVNWRVQKSLRDVVSKLYPTRSVELRFFGEVKVNLYGMDDKDVDLDTVTEEKETVKEPEEEAVEVTQEVPVEEPKEEPAEVVAEEPKAVEEEPKEEVPVQEEDKKASE